MKELAKMLRQKCPSFGPITHVPPMSGVLGRVDFTIPRPLTEAHISDITNWHGFFISGDISGLKRNTIDVRVVSKDLGVPRYTISIRPHERNCSVKIDSHTKNLSKSDRQKIVSFLKALAP